MRHINRSQTRMVKKKIERNRLRTIARIKKSRNNFSHRKSDRTHTSSHQHTTKREEMKIQLNPFDHESSPNGCLEGCQACAFEERKNSYVSEIASIYCTTDLGRRITKDMKLAMRNAKHEAYRQKGGYLTFIMDFGRLRRLMLSQERAK